MVHAHNKDERIRPQTFPTYFLIRFCGWSSWQHIECTSYHISSLKADRTAITLTFFVHIYLIKLCDCKCDCDDEHAFWHFTAFQKVVLFLSRVEITTGNFFFFFFFAAGSLSKHGVRSSFCSFWKCSIGFSYLVGGEQLPHQGVCSEVEVRWFLHLGPHSVR